MNIVCIDNNEGDLYLTREAIRKYFPTAQVSDFRYLHDFLKGNKNYDLVITDLGLPDAYGPDVIHRIREVTGKPIIVYSGVGGNAIPENILKAIKNSGATVFLSKNQNGLKQLPIIIQQFI